MPESELLDLTNFLRGVTSPRVERPALSARECFLRPPIFLRGDKIPRSKARNSATSSEVLNFSISRLDPSFRAEIELELDRSSRSEKFAFYCVETHLRAVKMEGQKRRSEKVAAKIFCGVATLPPRKALPVAHAKLPPQVDGDYCVKDRLYKVDCTKHTTLELRPIFAHVMPTLSCLCLLLGIFTYLAVCTQLVSATVRVVSDRSGKSALSRG